MHWLAVLTAQNRKYTRFEVVLKTKARPELYTKGVAQSNIWIDHSPRCVLNIFSIWACLALFLLLSKKAVYPDCPVGRMTRGS